MADGRELLGNPQRAAISLLRRINDLQIRGFGLNSLLGEGKGDATPSVLSAVLSREAWGCRGWAWVCHVSVSECQSQGSGVAEHSSHSGDLLHVRRIPVPQHGVHFVS